VTTGFAATTTGSRWRSSEEHERDPVIVDRKSVIATGGRRTDRGGGLHSDGRVEAAALTRVAWPV